MVGKWTNEPCSGVDEVVNHFWVLTPTPYIDQFIDNCVGSVILSFMDGFSGYNQIEILPVDQHKTTFIFPWGTFAYRKLQFGLKNAGATFQ